MSKKNHLDYLDKTFLEELNYKIWSTKGSRFNASTRLSKMARWSNFSLTMLSVYLTAIGLILVYNVNLSTSKMDENLIAYSITCLSILVLVLGQIEGAKDYSMKAKEFHNCGLELSKIYNDLRIYKTLKAEPTLEEKEQFARKISDAYHHVLEKHENHQQIDNDIFKTTKAEFHSLNLWDVFVINVRYYLKTIFIFHLLIFLPPIITITLLTK
jgi:SMODS and SLOG-associating 2TM effector domain family 5